MSNFHLLNKKEYTCSSSKKAFSYLCLINWETINSLGETLNLTWKI